MNVTKGFEFAFKLGFYACVADFVNAAFFEFYIRQRHHIEMEEHGFVSKTTQAFETIYAVMEWVFRGFYIIVSFLQAMIMSSKTGNYCINELGVLADEGHWLKWLIIVQVFKIVILSVWHILLNHKSQGFFSDQFDTTFFDDTTMMTQEESAILRQQKRRIAQKRSSGMHRKQ